MQQAGSVAIRCSVTPGGTGQQWGALRFPFAFLQAEANQASHLPVVKKGKKGGVGKAWRDQRAFWWEGQQLADPAVDHPLSIPP